MSGLIKLHALKTEAVVAELRNLAHIRHSHTVRLFEGGSKLSYADTALDSGFAHLIKLICHYAKTGVGQGLPRGHEYWDATHYLLYGSTVDIAIAENCVSQVKDLILEQQTYPYLAVGKDPQLAIECVLRAGIAREMLGQKSVHSLPIGYVATLSGLSVATMRVYTSREQLGSGTPGEIDRKLATAWLRNRGIPGPWQKW